MSTLENGREITFGEAVKEALIEEMHRDSHVFIIGEDVAEGMVYNCFSWLLLIS